MVCCAFLAALFGSAMAFFRAVRLSAPAPSADPLAWRLDSGRQQESTAQ
jgi:hypothetical protein